MILSYAQEAGLTRSQRWAKGKYATPSQKAALRRYLAGGIAALSLTDLALLGSHPNLTVAQRKWFTLQAMAEE